MESIVEIKDNHQLLGQVAHGAIEERQLLILCHVDVKAKVPKVAVRCRGESQQQMWLLTKTVSNRYTTWQKYSHTRHAYL